MSELKWSGWELRGSLLVAPRRVRLTNQEAKALELLLQTRINSKSNSHARWVTPEAMLRATGAGNIENGVRLVMSKLRTAVGRHMIETKRNVGYMLLPASEHRGSARSPIDELTYYLGLAYAEAKRLQKSIKEGLYDE